MKIKTILLFIASLALLAASDPSQPKGKIRSIQMSRWKDTLNYQYDKKGRVLSITTLTSYKTTYTYKNNRVTADTKGGSLVTMYLNSKGLVDSLTDIDSNRKTTSIPNTGFADDVMLAFGIDRHFPYTGNHLLSLDEIAGATTHNIISISKKFIYNREGFIKKEIVYTIGKDGSRRQVTATHSVENGNITSYTVTYPIDSIRVLNTKTGEYETKIVSQNDLTIRNSFDMSHLNTLAVNSLFGKSSKNVVIRSVRYYGASALPHDSTVTAFKYTFDAKGSVATLVTAVRSTDPPEYNRDKEMEDTCSFTYY